MRLVGAMVNWGDAEEEEEEGGGDPGGEGRLGWLEKLKGSSLIRLRWSRSSVWPGPGLVAAGSASVSPVKVLFCGAVLQCFHLFCALTSQPARHSHSRTTQHKPANNLEPGHDLALGGASSTDRGTWGMLLFVGRLVAAPMGFRPPTPRLRRTTGCSRPPRQSSSLVPDGTS